MPGMAGYCNKTENYWWLWKLFDLICGYILQHSSFISVLNDCHITIVKNNNKNQNELLRGRTFESGFFFFFFNPNMNMTILLLCCLSPLVVLAPSSGFFVLRGWLHDGVVANGNNCWGFPTLSTATYWPQVAPGGGPCVPKQIEWGTMCLQTMLLQIVDPWEMQLRSWINNFQTHIKDKYLWVFPSKLPSGECQRTSLMISPHWFR